MSRWRDCVASFVADFDLWAGFAGPGWSARRREDSTTDWVSAQFAHAHEMLFGCWVSGGRFWEVHAGDIRGSVCAPSSCEQDVVESVVVPEIDAHFRRRGGPVAPPINLGGTPEAMELTSWEQYKLDFVVAGVDGCGTTSLHRNLDRHPEVNMTTRLFDDLQFWAHRAMLPLRHRVDEFNSMHGKRGTARRSHRRLGMRAANLWCYTHSREILQRIPGLRVVLVLCNPFDRWEKDFLMGFCDRNRTAHARLCRRHVSECLTDPALIEEVSLCPRVADGLAEMRALFPAGRLGLLHQESLRAEPEATYGALARFLGLGPFPAGTRFPRHHSTPGRRTGACDDPALVAFLQERLAPEFDAVDGMMDLALLPPPAGVSLRRTRCDRIAGRLLAARGEDLQ